MDVYSAPITFLLLLCNVLISLFVLNGPPQNMNRLSFRPLAILRDKEYYRFLSAGFVHVDMGHLFVNMFTLFFFGPFLERRLGPVDFTVVYFGSMFIANAATLYFHRESESYSAVGASGAISGVLFAFCLFQPFSTIYLFAIVPIVAILYAVLFVWGSIYFMKRNQQTGRGMVAHEAHLGGAIGGILVTILVHPQSINIFLGQIGRFF